MPVDACWDRLRNETFLVVGFTDLTGLSVATLLEAHAIRYRISDLKPLDELRPLLAGLTIAEQDVFAGPQVVSQLEGITRIVLSPGVPRSIPLIADAVYRHSSVNFLVCLTLYILRGGIVPPPRSCTSRFSNEVKTTCRQNPASLGSKLLARVSTRSWGRKASAM